MRRPLVALVAGALIGLVAVPVWVAAAGSEAAWQAATFAILDLVLVTLAALQRPRVAIGAGMLLGVGLAFVYLFLEKASRCTPATGCTLGDNSLQVMIAASFVVSGAILTVIALRRRPVNATA